MGGFQMEYGQKNKMYAPILSASNKAVMVTEPGANEVVKGNAFSIRTTFSVESEEVFDFVIDPTALVAAGKRFTMYPTRWGTNQGYVEVTLGVCTAYDAGAAIVAENRNYFYRTSSPAKTICTYGVGRTITGLTLSNYKIPVGAEATAVGRGGGAETGGEILILDPSLIYVYRCTNSSGYDIKLGTFIQIFETYVDTDLGF